MLSLLLLFAPARADVTTPTDNTDTDDTSEECAALAEGDACTTADGAAGTCDADLACVAEEDKGCSTAGTPVAAGTVTLASLGLLALGRRRR